MELGFNHLRHNKLKVSAELTCTILRKPRIQEVIVEKVTRGSRVGGNRWKAGCIGGSGVETGGNVYLDMESG